MKKRFLALLLCAATAVMLASNFIGCSSADDEDKGQYFNAYLSNDVYDFDPANAYNNESLASIVGLMFDTLFELDADGKVQKSLVKKYWVEEDDNTEEYILYMRLKEATWSDGTAVSADDVVTAWKRLLAVDSSYPAASLLFDIKNARSAKIGDASIDDVGVVSAEVDLVEVRFEQSIDYDHFLLNLTSVALAPLRNDIIHKSSDWAKKPGTMVCSGPFRLSRVNIQSTEDETYMDYNWSEVGADAGGRSTVIYGQPGEEKSYNSAWITDFTLERNNYYYRDNDEDAIDKTVKPYRINVDCSLTPKQVQNQYEQGVILYVGDIPLAIRGDVAGDATVSKTSMSTASVLMNETALIQKEGSETGEALFAIKEVRQALSRAIDREALADRAVFADAATGLIPTGVWETGASESGGITSCSGCGIQYSTKTFRDACTATYSNLSYDMTAAKDLLSGAGVTPSDYSFSLTYCAYDDVQTAFANMLVEAWGENGLGFHVTLNKRGAIINNDYYKGTDSIPEDNCDDLYAEDLRSGNYEVIVTDITAYSVDPVGMLAPFAKGYTGMETDMSTPGVYVTPTHLTGYSNDDYDKIIVEIFEEKDIAARADALRAAEDTLMTDLPVIPLVFHKTATLQSSELKKLESTYYVSTTFTEAKLSDSDYENYLKSGQRYIDEHFDELTFNDAEGCLYAEYEAFKKSNTIYAHFYQVLAADETEGETETEVETEADAQE